MPLFLPSLRSARRVPALTARLVVTDWAATIMLFVLGDMVGMLVIRGRVGPLGMLVWPVFGGSVCTGLKVVATRIAQRNAHTGDISG